VDVDDNVDVDVVDNDDVVGAMCSNTRTTEFADSAVMGRVDA
jgi:hypothetical protein